MRLLAPLLLLLLSISVLHAQDQERKLIDRVLQPDMSLANPMQSMTYYSGNAGGVDSTKSANVKDFYFTRQFTPKTFETREYSAKNFWQGNFQFTTRAANVKTDSDADKVFATKPAPVKEARESGKGYATRGYTTREAMEKGKTSQAHLDETYLGKHQMNMDEVRDLLNKNHRADLTPIETTPAGAPQPSR